MAVGVVAMEVLPARLTLEVGIESVGEAWVAAVRAHAHISSIQTGRDVLAGRFRSTSTMCCSARHCAHHGSAIAASVALRRSVGCGPTGASTPYILRTSAAALAKFLGGCAMYPYRQPTGPRSIAARV
eukprot:CAMPEP_0185484960 /NCGR_PEP_ID=MMETSP1366-20130426/9708_1 /TAXON_ID=38817 /ORGANISM="Gephyrocapsa oceanica, Strain RCC1303" /LENGTH=127 /DNA_ID=CAMNT_0028093049 /DNA_START=603 /DNA_END=983 /DNA_ORIENTATION=+